MSSHSYTIACPNCGDLHADAMEDTREGSFLWCHQCGATLQPTLDQCSLEELNERREQQNEGVEVMEGEDGWLPPLTALPEWRLS